MVFIKLVGVCVPVPHIFKGTVQWELRGIKTGINRSKSTKATKNVYAPLVMVSLGARKRTLADKRVHHNGSIDTNFNPPPPPVAIGGLFVCVSAKLLSPPPSIAQER
jgi:hypothetical protein